LRALSHDVKPFNVPGNPMLAPNVLRKCAASGLCTTGA